MREVVGADRAESAAARAASEPRRSYRTHAEAGLREAARIVIPARRASTRLPEKLLLCDTGRTVLEHTIDRALAGARLSGSDDDEAIRRVWVACDDEELAKAARRQGVGVILTHEECSSGTERLWRALKSLPETDVVINLQADEPEMPAEWLADCMTAFRGDENDPDVVTVAVPIEAGDVAFFDPNVVKVVVDHRSRALYFSRASIPFLRAGGESPTPRGLRHVGIYAYSTRFLSRFAELPASDLENCERLEQLRFLQAGARIEVLVRPEPSVATRGIDTADDYRQFVERYHAQQAA